MSHHPNVERLLGDAADWRLIREEEAQHVNAAYERTHRAWVARNEGEANGKMQSFKPPFVKHEEVEQEVLTPGHRRVLFGMCAALAVCVAVAVAALNYWR